MKTGVYMIRATGEILLFFSCSWTTEYSVIVAETRGKVRFQKIPKAASHGKGIVYIGEYL
jgi:hypothetical protein